ncbi:MAG: hypothetical protein QJR12_16970 [Mycobacterium sp.]|uniref:glycosyltransferase family 39 protein n=1 Tax=Mycobacterium sp. TaxID=1785 RepID=UPI0026199CF0|nr:hypothetical protein [Mycobacterium sp.]MDI3315900.1 hypothetical protein [Mycobacterium sp.]
MRALGVLMWWAFTAANGRVNPRPWDADWYLKIAELGYRGAAVGMVDAHGVASPDGAMAFFPGYPLAVRGVAALTGGDYLAAGIAVSTLAGVIGAYGIARLTRRLGGGRRAEILAVVLVSSAPMSVVYSMAYPEALLVALSAWALVAVLERRWWLAAGCTAAAGATSPMAAPLILTVMVAAFWHLYRRTDRQLGAAVAPIVAPLGMLGYLLWVHETSTVPGGYFEITRRGWGNSIDFGATTLRWVVDALVAGRDAYVVLTAAAIVAAVVATAVVRMAWPVWLYTAATVALIVVHSGLVQDRVRLLLSAFPLLILAAIRLGRVRTRTAVLVAGAIALAGLWFGAYSVSVWPYAI